MGVRGGSGQFAFLWDKLCGLLWTRDCPGDGESVRMGAEGEELRP